jgi:hypothetical protein
MTRFVNGLTCVFVASAALSAAAAPAHHPISADQISSAISDAGMAVAPEQVTLLTRVWATTDTPRLKVRSIENSGNHTAIVRMECESPEQCLPFFVKTQMDHVGSTTAPSMTVRASPGATRVGSKPIVMRSGSQAVLSLEGDRVHIRIPVVSIQEGSPGDKIRVRACSNRQLYVAEVIDATSLKGRL